MSIDTMPMEKDDALQRQGVKSTLERERNRLKGDRQGLWAIDVNRNWRIVFEFKDGNAYVVDYEDYH